jgi:oligosaccharyltransferase complex subunit epsilon
MVDSLIALALALFFLQVTYGVLVCRDPFNSFIAGTFCSMGIFGLTASLRLQLSSTDFDSTPARMVFEYILGCLCLFFACFLLMG